MRRLESLPKTRNPFARSLREGYCRKRVAGNKKKYTRKGREAARSVPYHHNEKHGSSSKLASLARWFRERK